jgi:hormone-sensitive lipase
VQVRILCSKSLPVDFETGVVHIKKKREDTNQASGNILSNFFKRSGKSSHEHKAVILHVHGGGFISMSSASHQTYTRVWANEIGIPVFSVDYRLAPADAFPAAINDVWQVYYWIVLHAETFLGIKPEKIFVVGDSAGGNLVSALTVMAIKRGFRVPDAMIMCYPALNLSKTVFTPSHLLAIDDPILPYAFLNM